MLMYRVENSVSVVSNCSRVCADKLSRRTCSSSSNTILVRPRKGKGKKKKKKTKFRSIETISSYVHQGQRQTQSATLGNCWLAGCPWTENQYTVK